MAGARSMGAVEGHRRHRPVNEEEEVKSDGWRLAEGNRVASLRATLPDSAGQKSSKIPSADSGQFPCFSPAKSRWVPALRYGHGFYRLDSAAKGYFGLPSAILTPFEIAQLVVLTRSSSRYDPWCRQKENVERAADLVTVLVSDRATRIKPAPAHACS